MTKRCVYSDIPPKTANLNSTNKTKKNNDAFLQFRTMGIVSPVNGFGRSIFRLNKNAKKEKKKS